MNEQQSNGEIRFEDIMLETAWMEVENTFRAAGEVAPLPGFTSRWMERLELARQREERLQATALIITNLVIAFGFIILISMQFVPSVSSGGLTKFMDRPDLPHGDLGKDGVRCFGDFLPHDPSPGTDIMAGERVHIDGDCGSTLDFDGKTAYPGARSST